MVDIEKASGFMWFFSDLFWEAKENNENTELLALDQKHQKQRSSFLGEWFESSLNRRAPGLSKLADMTSSLWLIAKDPEVVSRQNEFESFSARSMFVPDFLLKIITIPITKIPGFELLVKKYPLWGKVKNRLLDSSWNLVKDPDPDDIINFLRLVHQDFISWKNSLDSVTS